MKKTLIILGALGVVLSFTPALANDGNNERRENKEYKNYLNSSRGFDVACVQDAIRTRDNSVITALDTFHATTKSIIEKRRDDLVLAWAITDPKARREARKTAQRVERDARETAHETLRASRKSIWENYRVTMKTKCGVSGWDRYAEDAQPVNYPASAI